MSDYVVTLDPETHIYTVFKNGLGVVVRSQSKVMREAEEACCMIYEVDHFGFVPDFSRVHEDVLQNARARGKQVDMAASEIINHGSLTEADEARVRESGNWAYVEAFERAWKGYFHNPEDKNHWNTQTPMYSEELDVCGTPDIDDDSSVNDVKCTWDSSPTWGLQLGFYEIMHGNCAAARVIWLRPRLKPPKSPFEIHHRGDPKSGKIFSPMDHDVVRAISAKRYDDPVIWAWREKCIK